MNSAKVTSEIEADPLEQLKAWASGAPSPVSAQHLNKCCLSRQQQVRLWNLMSSPSKPGVLSSSHVPR